jgi:hypothetical protein
MLATATIAFAMLAATGREGAPSNVELVKLADGVYAAIRKEPLSLAVNSNSLIVVGDRDVLVVDAQFTREATLETLAAIRSVTALPVRYVTRTRARTLPRSARRTARGRRPARRRSPTASTASSAWGSASTAPRRRTTNGRR